MIELDGSHGEGGGALVRTALALSTITKKPFKITNIRAGRSKQGLKAQHLEAIKALKQMCNATTNDIQLGSTTLEFYPREIKGGIFTIDIGTAGSISLLLQALILPAMFAPKKVTFNITGGTCGKWQASVDYIKNVLFPHLEKFVEKIDLKVLKRGYFPKGGGQVKVEIHPRFIIDHSFTALLEELQMKTRKILLTTQGELEQVRGVVNLSADLQDNDVAMRIIKAAKKRLEKLDAPVSIREEYSNSLSTGGEIVLWAIFGENGKVDPDNPVILGTDLLLEKGKSSEEIGKNVGEKLLNLIDQHKPIEEHLADQLIPYMALLPGSQITPTKITDHTHTNIFVVEKFLPVGYKISDSITVENFSE